MLYTESMGYGGKNHIPADCVRWPYLALYMVLYSEHLEALHIHLSSHLHTCVCAFMWICWVYVCLNCTGAG